MSVSYSQRVYNGVKAVAWDTAKGALYGTVCGLTGSVSIMTKLWAQEAYVYYRIGQVQNPHSCQLSDESVIPRDWRTYCVYEGNPERPTIKINNFGHAYTTISDAIAFPVIGAMAGATIGALYGAKRAIRVLTNPLN